MLCQLSKLDDNALKSIRDLESEIGKPLISYSCHNVDIANLKDDDLEKIKKLEKELSVSLVAVKA